MKKITLLVAVLLCLGITFECYSQTKNKPKPKHRVVQRIPPAILPPPEIMAPEAKSNNKEEETATPVSIGLVEVKKERNEYSNNQIATSRDILAAHATKGIPASAVRPNSLYIHTSNGTLLAYNYNKSCEERWKITGVEKDGSNSFSLIHHNIFLPDQKGRILGINPVNGKAFWDNRIGLEKKERQLRGQNASGSDGILYIAASNQVLYAIEEQTGKLIWNYSLPYEWQLYPPKSGWGKVVVTSAPFVFCFEAATGKPLWQRNMGKAMYAALAMDKEKIYAPDESHTIYALDAVTGATEWQFELPAKQFSVGHNILLEDKVLYIANANINSGGKGTVYALNANTGILIWKTDVSDHAAVNSIRLQDGRLIGSSDKTVFALSSKDGSIIQTDEMPEMPLSNILFVDGAYLYLTAKGLVHFSSDGQDAAMGTTEIADTGYTSGTLKLVNKNGFILE